jgi:hypothetical protein
MADQINLEGMGSQFDPELERYYRASRPRLEAYYAGAAEEPEVSLIST